MCDEEKRDCCCENEVPCSDDNCHANCGPDCNGENEQKCCCHCCCDECCSENSDDKCCCDCEDCCCDCEDCCCEDCCCGKCCCDNCCEGSFKSECLDLAKEVVKAMIISAAATASAVGVTALLTRLIRK